MNESGVGVSLQTVQRVLFEQDFLDFEHLLKMPKLEPHHAKARLN